MNLTRVSDNKFSATDDNGRKCGTARISRMDMSRIFPDCPVQFEITVESTEEAKVLLYSAAITRARVLSAECAEANRIYAVVEPNDKTAFEIVHSMGFKSYDGIVRMVRPIDEKLYGAKLPEGCTYVKDFLENPGESVRCLKRYNECFGRSEKGDWLEDIKNSPDFVRIMVVSGGGLCGELLAWSRGDTGVIGVIQTARAWRRQNVATCLIEEARKYFAKRGMLSMSFDVWRASPGCKRLAEKAGFTEHKIICAYPEYVD